MLEALGITVFVLILLAGLLMVPFGLPGTFVMVADAAVYGLFTHWERVNLALVLLLLGLAIAGELLEQLIGSGVRPGMAGEERGYGERSLGGSSARWRAYRCLSWATSSGPS